jgi:hypothetical protein
MAGRHPRAFFSYTRFDNEHARDKLSHLRKRLEDELRGQLGSPFEIFQDVVDLAVGVDFQQRIASSINEAIFFIPVVTPSYFESKACIEELQAFRAREYSLLYEELIVPVYWININLPDNDLASELLTRNYADFRKIRQKPADSTDMDEKIELLATGVIQRLHEFNDHHVQVAGLTATIGAPTAHERVERHVVVSGTTTSLPRSVTPWLVVEAGGGYHPQVPITATTWTGRVTVGTKGFGADNNRDFPIHVIAASKTANQAFRQYIDAQSKLPKEKAWRGLSLPAGTRILRTTIVRRDDHAALLARLLGTYDEFRARPPQATGGTIAITGTPHGTLALAATNHSGAIEWRGTITVHPKTGAITGEYKHANGDGQGTMELTQEHDEISITGQDKATNAKPFYMLWRRQTP